MAILRLAQWRLRDIGLGVECAEVLPNFDITSCEWENSLRQLEAARAELTRCEQQRPRALRAEERTAIRSLGNDLKSVWSAPTTTDRDRKELLHALLEEVVIALQRDDSRAHLMMRWRGGAITQLDVPIPRFQPMGLRTDEDTFIAAPPGRALSR